MKTCGFLCFINVHPGCFEKISPFDVFFFSWVVQHQPLVSPAISTSRAFAAMAGGSISARALVASRWIVTWTFVGSWLPRSKFFPPPWNESISLGCGDLQPASQDASCCHQNCYIFEARGLPINLHLPLLLGGGHTQHIPPRKRNIDSKAF